MKIIVKKLGNNVNELHKKQVPELWKREKEKKYLKIELKFMQTMNIINANGCIKWCNTKQQITVQQRVIIQKLDRCK